MWGGLGYHRAKVANVGDTVQAVPIDADLGVLGWYRRTWGMVRRGGLGYYFRLLRAYLYPRGLGDLAEPGHDVLEHFGFMGAASSAYRVLWMYNLGSCVCISCERVVCRQYCSADRCPQGLSSWLLRSYGWRRYWIALAPVRSLTSGHGAFRTTVKFSLVSILGNWCGCRMQRLVCICLVESSRSAGSTTRVSGQPSQALC